MCPGHTGLLGAAGGGFQGRRCAENSSRRGVVWRHDASKALCERGHKQAVCVLWGGS